MVKSGERKEACQEPPLLYDLTTLQKEANTKLNLSLIHIWCAEEVKGEINGKPYQGIVYSAMNDKGEKVGNPVKASRIGKSVGYEAVRRRMEKSGEAIKYGKLKERTRKIVATAMQTARIRKELEQQLKKQGIDVVFRQNDSGRI